MNKAYYLIVNETVTLHLSRPIIRPCFDVQGRPVRVRHDAQMHPGILEIGHELLLTPFRKPPLDSSQRS